METIIDRLGKKTREITKKLNLLGAKLDEGVITQAEYNDEFKILSAQGDLLFEVLTGEAKETSYVI